LATAAVRGRAVEAGAERQAVFTGLAIEGAELGVSNGGDGHCSKVVYGHCLDPAAEGAGPQVDGVDSNKEDAAGFQYLALAPVVRPLGVEAGPITIAGDVVLPPLEFERDVQGRIPEIQLQPVKPGWAEVLVHLEWEEAREVLTQEGLTEACHRSLSDDRSLLLAESGLRKDPLVEGRGDRDGVAGADSVGQEFELVLVQLGVVGEDLESAARGDVPGGVIGRFLVGGGFLPGELRHCLKPGLKVEVGREVDEG